MAGNKLGGLKSADVMRKKYGEDYFKKLASVGGKSGNKKSNAQKLKEKYGENYFTEIRMGIKFKEKNGN